MSTPSPDRTFAPPYEAVGQAAPPQPLPTWTYRPAQPPPSGAGGPAWPEPPRPNRLTVWGVPAAVGVVAVVVGFLAGAWLDPLGGLFGFDSGNATTREEPAELGSVVTVLNDPGEWQVSLGEPTYDADDLVLGLDPLNEPAPPGQAYVVVPVTATYHGPDRGSAGAELWVSFVTAGGNSYDESSLFMDEGFVGGPDPLYAVGDAYDGATVTGNVTLAIPVGAQHEEGAVWVVETDWLGDTAYFAAP